jgi:hypothetical protein
MFPQHLEVLNFFYGHPCPCGITTIDKSTLMVPIVLLGWDLNAQQGLVKLTMKLKYYS